MFRKTYRVLSNGTLLIYHKDGVKDYCLLEKVPLNRFNMPVKVDDSVNDCTGLLENCSRFDSDITLHNDIVSCDSMLKNCFEFNRPITIPSSAVTCAHMFYGCSSFNQPITIPNGVRRSELMFARCIAFNQPISIPSGIRLLNRMFYGCLEFNQSVVIPDGAIRCDFMFYECVHLNSPITIPDSVENCSYMFGCCYHFNQPVNLPKGLKDCSSMFSDCNDFNQPLCLPDGVEYLHNFLTGTCFNSFLRLPCCVNDYDCMLPTCYKHMVIIDRHCYSYYKGTHNLAIVGISTIMTAPSPKVPVVLITELSYKAIRNETVIDTEHTSIVLFDGIEDMDFNTFIDDFKYHRDLLVEVFDALLSYALEKGFHQFVVSWLDYKNSHNLYEDDPFKKLRLDDDNDTNTGETNLF